MARRGRNIAPDPRRNADLAPVMDAQLQNARDEIARVRQEARAEIEHHQALAEMARDRQHANNRQTLSIMHLLATPGIPQAVKNRLIDAFVRGSNDAMAQLLQEYGGNRNLGDNHHQRWRHWLMSIWHPPLKWQWFLLALQCVVYFVGGTIRGSIDTFQIQCFIFTTLTGVHYTFGRGHTYVPFFIFSMISAHRKIGSIIQYLFSLE